MYRVSCVIIVISNKCTTNITTVYITVVSLYLIHIPIFFDISMSGRTCFIVNKIKQ